VATQSPEANAAYHAAAKLVELPKRRLMHLLLPFPLKHDARFLSVRRK
jgi:hypothetical protein